jgi:CRP-like cAMP-binding protein
MELQNIKQLAVSPLFEGISPAELTELLNCLNPSVRSFSKNDCITIAGNPLHGVGLILAGTAAVTKDSIRGERVIMTLLTPGGIFGEIAVFSGQGFWPATVVAQGECQVVFLAPEKFVSACSRQCEFHRRLIMNMLRILADKALILNRKVEYLVLKSMRGKISAFLLEQYARTGKATFLMPLKRNELADFLNVSRPSLSREMARMRDEGIIDFHRSSIQIKDLAALRNIDE